MNRILLACIALALPSFASAAPCDILPYANQCQGSNLWPVPAGWLADSNGDCQAEPPLLGTIRHSGWFYVNGDMQGVGAGAQPAMQAWFKGNTGFSTCAELPQSEWVTYVTYRTPWSGGVCSSGSSVIEFRGCDAGYAINGSSVSGNVADAGGYVYFCTGTSCTYVRAWSGPVECRRTSSIQKPSDGDCTARWTSSAMTTLQKDPLDPDCDANSCAFDGTCKLR